MTNSAVGTYISNVLAASGDIVQLEFSAGASDIGLVLGGTFSGNVQFEVGLVNLTTGITWTALTCDPVPSGSGVTSATAAGTWSASIAGFTHFRFRCSAYASGRVYATVNATLAANAGVTSLNSIAGTLVLTSPDSSVTITPNGQYIELEAAGGISGAPLAILGVNAGGDGATEIPNSSFDATSGSVTLFPASPADGLALTSLGGNGLISTAYGTPDSAGSAINGNSYFTDNSGSGIPNIGALFNSYLRGTDVTGNSAYGVESFAGTIPESSTGTPQELTAYYCEASGSNGIKANIVSGLHVTDQNSLDLPANVTNAAILIDDQTAGANVYAIKTGLGPVKFGDVLQLTPVTFAGLPATPSEGWTVPITDSNTGTFGATISAGSSTHHGLAYYDGSNWTFR